MTFYSTELAVEFAKRVLPGGTTGTTRREFAEAIATRAKFLKRQGETDASAFTRAITEDTAGRTLYAASKLAPGPDHEPGSTALGRAPERSLPAFGPAGTKLQQMADDNLKAHPELGLRPITRKPLPDGGKARAFNSVYNAPENADLRDEAAQEHLAAAYRLQNAALTKPGAADDDDPGTSPSSKQPSGRLQGVPTGA